MSDHTPAANERPDPMLVDIIVHRFDDLFAELQIQIDRGTSPEAVSRACESQGIADAWDEWCREEDEYR